jgi:hypothetical protein
MMLDSFTLKLLFFVCGVLLGIYLPLAGLYLLSSIRKGPSGFRLVWTTFLRVILVLFGFLVLLVAIGMVTEIFPVIEQLEKRIEYYTWLGGGAIFAFFAGAILFFVGIWKAWRTRTA